jgi:hypothetical protein
LTGSIGRIARGHQHVFTFGILLGARICHASAQSPLANRALAPRNFLVCEALPGLLEELQPYNGPKTLGSAVRGPSYRLLYSNACYSKPFHPSPRHLRMSIHTPIERPTSLLPLFTFPSCIDGDGIITQQPHTPRLQITYQQKFEKWEGGDLRVP